MCRENLAAIFHAQDRDDDTAHEHETVINACKQRLIYKRFGRSKLQRVCIENCLSTQGASKDLGEITIDIILSNTIEVMQLDYFPLSRRWALPCFEPHDLRIFGSGYPISLCTSDSNHSAGSLSIVSVKGNQFQITTVTGRPGDESNRHHEQRASE
ncbi:hypothetical protein FGSG_06475 [Fusarium graminearum PH-1]|uniref:Chromosome 4, complete genome n=1 Tax=Gibberella zeae (strain ATCC MYA-4620 / CBS 123657 / FGSC 9075 / NRRL 31084 / PH-1) TaxID=229533 RepID=I1RQX4_GIBZE|nr:hypothetical protein FGSG_06475 [Fusarium graminearum PH-1]ESU12569.1 hypothetical protein FGSG_06475 [Fusarium graminearum PH-1]CEF85403.1 unnamed protein product [Fusarium graminearum]|eukprot:XP_011326076.1 hypothetical protein FGSG_06475 [Fusarium graminearum PH-1]